MIRTWLTALAMVIAAALPAFAQAGSAPTIPQSFLMQPSELASTLKSGPKPVILQGDAFGDDTTDVVTVHDTDRIQAALSRAHHVAVKFQYGPTQVGEDAFTFGGLAAERATLMAEGRLEPGGVYTFKRWRFARGG